MICCFPVWGIAATFEEWQPVHFDSVEMADEAISGPLADPEKDGRVNLMEYAMGSDPKATDGGPTGYQPDLGASTHGLTFTEATGTENLEWLFQSSPNLTHWITHNSVIESSRVPGSGLDTVTVDLPVPSGPPGRQFARIKIDLDSLIALRAPTGVSAVYLSTTSARVDWSDNCNIETGQRIERRLPDVSGWELVGTVADDVITYTDNTIPFQAGWEYRVVALGENATTAASAGSIIGTFLDSDGDGIPDAAELGSNYAGAAGTFPTDPNNPSSGGSGVPDGWFAANGFDPMTHDPSIEDSDQDGLTDYIEFLVGTDPNNPDSDGDSLLDGEEAVPLCAAMQAPAAPETSYAMIDLSSPATLGYEAAGLNDGGQVLLIGPIIQEEDDSSTVSAKVWSNGTVSNELFGALEAFAQAGFAGPLEDGSVYYLPPQYQGEDGLSLVDLYSPYQVWSPSGSSQTGIADSIYDLRVSSSGETPITIPSLLLPRGLPGAAGQTMRSLVQAKHQLFHQADFWFDAIVLSQVWPYALNDAHARMIAAAQGIYCGGWDGADPDRQGVNNGVDVSLFGWKDAAGEHIAVLGWQTGELLESFGTFAAGGRAASNYPGYPLVNAGGACVFNDRPLTAYGTFDWLYPLAESGHAYFLVNGQKRAIPDNGLTAYDINTARPEAEGPYVLGSIRWAEPRWSVTTTASRLCIPWARQLILVLPPLCRSWAASSATRWSSP